MRGRTNIPPRVGGIVNGVVREYQVAEEDGIAIGDYVEFVASNTSHVRGLLTASQYDFGNDIKEEYGAGRFSTRLFELSNGKYCMFYSSSSSSNVTAIAQLFQEINGTFVEERITLSDVIGGYAYSYTNFACEIAKDKFLLLLAPYYSTYAAGYILRYNGAQFDVTKLTLISDLGNIYSRTGSTEKGMYKWSDDLYVIPTESNESITIARLSESANTFTFVSNLLLDSSDSSIQILGKYNGYLVVLVDGERLYTISISTSGIATIVSTTAAPSSTYNIGSQYIKLNDDVLFYIAGLYELSYTEDDKDLTIAVTVIRILDNGTIDVNATVSKKYVDCLYQRRSGGYNTSEFATMFYHNGIVFGIASGIGASSSTSGSTVYDVLKDLFSLPVEISTDGTVTFGDISVQHLSYSDSSATSGRSYNLCGRGTVKSDGTVCILVKEGLAIGKPVYVMKPSKEGLSNLYAADLMKKYATKISGIAKTAGAKDELIEVYAPR